MTSLRSPLPPPLAPKRILVLRLDRIGDVVLSTPVVQVMRQRFPHAFIAIMVRRACRDLVQGNPYLNEVILYDKEVEHRGAWSTIRFARGLRRYEFDTALALHPSNRSHWIPWLAGIPVRIGYDWKARRLLTHPLHHRKQEGARHEALYTLDMLKIFGIDAGDPRPHVPIEAAANRRVEALLAESAAAPARLIAVHPSASCVSKRWMPARFAEVADRLIAQQSARICLIGDEPDAIFAHQTAQAMRHPALNLAGQLSLAELAALLRHCRLLVSNDSGPVHIAAAVGTPVVDIFGRNNRGLSPQRWKPLGEGHVVLHKEVGCVTCLHKYCDIDFLCLTSLTAEEVYAAAVSALSRAAQVH